jgi:hypothetical protein
MKAPLFSSNLFRRAASAVAALLMGACGASDATGSTATAALTLTADPNPVVGSLCGGHCGNLPGEREALTTLTIRESARRGVTLTGGSQQLRAAATGAVIATSTFAASDFVRDAGTARIPAGGQLVYHAGVNYGAAHDGVAATFSFTFQGTDDNGHAVSVTLAVPTTG